MKTYTLTQDVFSQTLSATGVAISEGYLPAGTVVRPVNARGTTSPWTGHSLSNRAPGVVVRIVRQANGQSAKGLALENLCVDSVAEVSR